MQIITELFNQIFFGPSVNLLVFLIRSLQSLHIPGAFGFAIIIMTIVIRLLVWPLMATQLKSAKKLMDLKPHLDELKRKHKDDKQSFAKAQMELYKQHGVNPAGGCLPLLIQFPFLIALYQTIFAFFNGTGGLERVNQALYTSSWHLSSPPDPNFFGLNIALKPADFNHAGIFLLAIPVITGALQLVQSKMMAPKALKAYPTDSSKELKEKESVEDSMVAVQGQMLFLMPVMIGYFAFQFPIALSLYWNTLTIFTMLQQYLISGWGGLGEWLEKVPTRKL